MNTLTLNDRWKMFCMRVLLRAKKHCVGSKSIVLKGVAYTINLEIRDLDKRYFKERLTGICTAYNILHTASGDGVGGKQQLFYHTFRILTHRDMLVDIRAAEFPHEFYNLLKGPGQRRQGTAMKADLWHIQQTNMGNFNDCYLLANMNAGGEHLTISVWMPNLDRLFVGRRLKCGDIIRVTADPVGPLHYEVLDEIGLDELNPGLAKWLEDPDTAAALKQHLNMKMPETAP